MIYFKVNGFTKKSLKNLNPAVWVAIFLTMANIFLILANLFYIPALYDSKAFEYVDVNSPFQENEKVLKHKFGDIWDILFVFGGTFQVFAALQIIISWIDVLINLEVVFPAKENAISQKTIKRLIQFIMFIIVVIFLVLAGFRLIEHITIIYVVVSVLLSLCYSIGYFGFRKQAKQSLRDLTERPFSLIEFTFRINVICLVLAFLFGMAGFANLYTYEETLQIGQFNYIQVLLTVSILFGYIQMTSTSYYVHEILCVSVDRHETRWMPTCIFKENATEVTNVPGNELNSNI